MKKYIASIVAVLTCSLYMNSVSAASVNVAIDSSPAGLDPHLITAFNSVIIVQNNIYEGLTNIGSDLSVVPGLAKSWDVSSDGLTYTFNLHSGVTFHDGSAMDAVDVISSISRVQNTDIASPLASRVSPIVDMSMVDDETVQFKLNEPSPIFGSRATVTLVSS